MCLTVFTRDNSQRLIHLITLILLITLITLIHLIALITPIHLITLIHLVTPAPSCSSPPFFTQR